MWTWEQVVDQYRVIGERPKYYDLAQNMIRLIDEIQQHPEFSTLEARLALGALTLGLPDKTRHVHIYWTEKDLYEIFLDHCEGEFYGENVVVPFSQVLSTVKVYLEKL